MRGFASAIFWGLLEGLAIGLAEGLGG